MKEIKAIIAVNDDKIYQDYIGTSIKKYGIIAACITNSRTDDNSIFKKYNAGIDSFINQTDERIKLKDDDIMCFIHEDVVILDPNFREKINLVFKKNTNVGMVGVCGATEMSKRGGWYMNTPNIINGHLMQEYSDGSSKHLTFGDNIGYFNNVVIDGFFMAIKGKLLIDGLRFDEKAYTGFDFYDLDISLSVLEKGFDVVVADILFKHKSEGNGVTTDNWKKNKEIFIKKWENKGYNFPLTQEQFKKALNV